MVAKIMRKVLASIALVSVLSAQIISTNALSLSEDLTSETVNRTAVMLSAEEKKTTVGENAEALLGDFFIGQKGLAETDLTGGAYVEFQLSVSGYDKIEALVDETVSAEVNKKLPDALKEALKGVEGDEAIAATTEQVTAAVTADAKAGVMQLVFTSVGGGSVTCDFFDQIKGDGVTDVRIIKADEKRVAQDDNFNWGKVTGWNLQFGEKVAKIAAGDAFDAEIGVKNLRTAFFRPVPNVPSSALDVLEFEPFFRSLGKGDPSATGAWSFDIFMNVNLEAADFSQAEFIEFDFYVSDYDKTMALFEVKENVGLRLSLGSEPANRYGARAVYDFQNQLKKTDAGWSHVKVPVGDLFPLGEFDRGSVSNWMIGLEGLAGFTLGDACDLVFGVANICGTPGPDTPPANAVVTFDTEETSATLGNGEVDAQFHYFSDILYKVGLPAKDFSQADFVELDLYISDYETLKSVMDASDGKVNDLLFCIGSKEGDRYANRWGASIWPLLADVGEDGWVHLKLKKSDFQNMGSGLLDWTQACTWGFSFNGPNFVGLPVGDAWDVRITVKNIYATAKPVLVQPDPDKPAKPDKDAIYLSDCEKMVEENGDSWNPATVQIDTTYKTEGKASVSQKFMQQPDTSNVMRYVFEQKDFSKVKTLKFDVFVDDLDLMAKTKFAVSLTGDNRGTSKYFRWDVDTTSWKPGWNSVEIDVTKGFTKDDGADMSKIRCFVFGAKDSAFAEGDELIVRLDNLRVTGSLDAGDPSNPSNPSTPEDPSSPTENESSTAGDPTGSESENPGTGAATGAAAFAVMAAAGGALLVSRRRGK